MLPIVIKRACAARVIVVGLCVCVCMYVCMYVSLSHYVLTRARIRIVRERGSSSIDLCVCGCVHMRVCVCVSKPVLWLATYYLLSMGIQYTKQGAFMYRQLVLSLEPAL